MAPDRVMLLAPPFDMAQAEVVASSEDALSGHTYARDGRFLFAGRSTRGASGGPRRQDILAWSLGGAQPVLHVLAGDVDPEDPLTQPGRVMTRRTGNGVVWAIVSRDGTAAFLEGDGFKADFRPRPFIDRVTIVSAEKTRLFEGSADSYDRPLAALDDELSV